MDYTTLSNRLDNINALLPCAEDALIAALGADEASKKAMSLFLILGDQIDRLTAEVEAAAEADRFRKVSITIS